jgi:hypothetical protein
MLLCSCASVPFIGSLSPQAAQREARDDIARGHMKLYRAGTYASYEVGVEPADRPLVAKLPRDNRLSHGCTDPHASEHIAYARAYNREIVRYLRGHPNI